MARTAIVPSWWMLCACLARCIIHAHAVSNYVPNDGPCLNKNAQCVIWAEAGECMKTPDYMWANCWAACSSACLTGKGEPDRARRTAPTSRVVDSPECFRPQLRASRTPWPAAPLGHRDQSAHPARLHCISCVAPWVPAPPWEPASVLHANQRYLCAAATPTPPFAQVLDESPLHVEELPRLMRRRLCQHDTLHNRL
jgi:hypothetical protein